MADYKVAILAAGHDTQFGKITENINKAILPVGFRGVISHIIEKFPQAVEFVVAVGYAKEILKEYLNIAHSDRKFTYVDVEADNITGQGHSLLKCKEELQCPFIVSTVDTIVLENIPRPTVDWLGITPINNGNFSNSVKLEHGFVKNMTDTFDKSFDPELGRSSRGLSPSVPSGLSVNPSATLTIDKTNRDNTHAFIGICGISNYAGFWKAIEQKSVLISGEPQLSDGLKALIDGKDGMCGVEFTWFDTGTTEGYEKTKKYFNKGAEDPTLSRTDELLYFVGGNVIKYFSDATAVERIIRRAEESKEFTPHIEASSTHFYRYEKIPGHSLYEGLIEKTAADFFEWLNKFFGEKRDLSREEQAAFENACGKFYRAGTNERVSQYFKTFNREDAPSIVNGNPTPTISELLGRIPWERLTKDGIPSTFHGDLQFDNVLVTKSGTPRFVLSDWRPDFAGLGECGDRYYDLAKLYSGMILPYNLIKKGTFFFQANGDRINLDIASSYVLQNCRVMYEEFLASKGYDINKVKLLAAIIFLNMSPLHKAPFSFLLFHLGKLELKKTLEATIK